MYPGQGTSNMQDGAQSRIDHDERVSVQVRLAEAEQRVAAAAHPTPGLAALAQLRLHCLREKATILQSDMVNPQEREPSRCAP